MNNKEVRINKLSEENINPEDENITNKDDTNEKIKRKERKTGSRSVDLENRLGSDEKPRKNIIK